MLNKCYSKALILKFFENKKYTRHGTGIWFLSLMLRENAPRNHAMSYLYFLSSSRAIQENLTVNESDYVFCMPYTERGQIRRFSMFKCFHKRWRLLSTSIVELPTCEGRAKTLVHHCFSLPHREESFLGQISVCGHRNAWGEWSIGSECLHKSSVYWFTGTEQVGPEKR